MVTGWLLSNIRFAVALLKALRISSDFILSFPCALVVTKALKNINGVDVFGFLLLVAFLKASFHRLLATKNPHCSCGLCDPVRIQT